MLLVIDVGNTNITMGTFRHGHLNATWRIHTNPHSLHDEYGLLVRSLLAAKQIDPNEVNGAALCSVVPSLTGVFEEMCSKYLDVVPLVVESGTRTGVRVLYENPRDVGADRVVDAAAAFQLYGGPVIIVDFGTATVLDAVSSEGDYLGGAVAPGLIVSADALTSNTAQLRRVELEPPKTMIGRNTVSSIQSGLIFGHVGLVEHMVDGFKRELGPNTKVVATGGLASVLAKQTKVFDVVNTDLTLIGLKIIYDLNAGP